MEVSNGLSLYRRYFAVFFVWVLPVLMVLQYFTDPYERKLGFVYMVFPGALIAINILPDLRKARWFSDSKVSPIAQHIIWACFIISTQRLFTPYYFVMIMLMFAAAYYFELFGGLLSLLTIVLTLALSWLARGLNLGPTFDTQSMFASSFLLLLTGLYFEHMTAKDRTERRQLNKLFHDANLEQLRLQSLINNIAEAFIAIDKDQKITLYNHLALELLGVGGDMHNVPLSAQLELYRSDNTRIGLPSLLMQARNPYHRDDITMVNKHGARKLLALNISPVRSNDEHDHEPQGYVLLLRDISREKSLEAQRDDFIAITSHELRTPLTVARGAVELLKGTIKDKLADNEQKILDGALDNLNRLMVLTDNLLLLTKAQRELLPIELKMVDPISVAHRLRDEFAKQASQKGLSFNTEFQSDAHPILTSEETMYEILRHFISNALKFTSAGSITLSVRAMDSQSIVYSVQDTGIGISESDQKKLFHKFYQVENIMTRNVEGTGLGLYISFLLAQRINARVWCESNGHNGATFYLEVPPQSFLAKDEKQAAEVKLDHLVESF